MDTSTLAQGITGRGSRHGVDARRAYPCHPPRDAHPTGDGPAGSIKSDSAANRSVSLNRSRTIEIASGIYGTSEITIGATSCQSLQFSWCFSLLRSRSAGSFSELKFAPNDTHEGYTVQLSVDRFRVRRESDRNWVGWLRIPWTSCEITARGLHDDLDLTTRQCIFRDSTDFAPRCRNHDRPSDCRSAQGPC